MEPPNRVFTHELSVCMHFPEENPLGLLEPAKLESLKG